jgi:cytochrome c biogenesis protein CcmG, thiol:disulfide interchange protein DsbE
MITKQGVILASLAVLLAGCMPQMPASEKESAVSPGEFVGADFNIPNLVDAGSPLSLAPYRGQVVLLDFWATWNPPCQAELPILNRLYSDLKEKGFVVVGMTIDNSPEAQVSKAIAGFQLDYPVGLAGADVQQAYGGIRVIPTKFLLDKNGNVVKRYEGVVSEEQVRADVENLLAM